MLILKIELLLIIFFIILSIIFIVNYLSKNIQATNQKGVNPPLRLLNLSENHFKTFSITEPFRADNLESAHVILGLAVLIRLHYDYLFHPFVASLMQTPSTRFNRIVAEWRSMTILDENNKTACKELYSVLDKLLF